MWHFNPELNRDIWADDAAHPIDFLQWLLGVPETVTAEVSSLLNPLAPNDNGIAIYRYADGMLAEVDLLLHLRGRREHGRGDRREGQHRPELRRRAELQRAAAGRRLSGKSGTRSTRRTGRPATIPSPASHGARIAGLSQSLSDFFHGRRRRSPPPKRAAPRCAWSLPPTSRRVRAGACGWMIQPSRWCSTYQTFIVHRRGVRPDAPTCCDRPSRFGGLACLHPASRPSRPSSATRSIGAVRIAITRPSSWRASRRSA